MNVDIAIVVAFLALNLIAGVYSGRGIKTIREYAIGNRNFSTATIAATILATWTSGSFFTICISQTYKDGIWFLPAALGTVLCLFLVGYILAPRMKEFFGSISVAEAMGGLYGRNVRIITAVCAIAQATAMTALQIKVFSTVFSYFFGFSSIYATCISSFVVIFYSAWGGIKSVTFTDVIQFATFGVFIPLFLLFIWQIFGNTEVIAHAFETNPLLDYKQLANWHDPKFFPSLGVFFWFLIPTVNASMFQRVLMTKNTTQIRQSFGIAALGYFVIILFVCAIAVLVLSINPNLDPNNIVMHIIDNYSFTGLKGITLVGIMAMVMSTADSWINTGAVIFAHDFCKPLGIKFKNELFLSRAFTLLVGVGAVALVVSNHNLFKLFSLQGNFYMPIVTVPLILAIFGFRSTPRAVILGMGSGVLCAVIWTMYVKDSTGVDSIIPAMVANFSVLMLSHYALREPGGWVGIKDDSDLKELRRQRQNRIQNVLKFFKNLHTTNPVVYCRQNVPKSEMTYIYFAFSVMMTVITTFLLDRKLYQQHIILINILQGAALCISTIFLCHKLWASSFKERYIGVIWYASVFFGLAFISSFIALISQFSQVSLVIFILNLALIGLLMNWQTTLLMIVSGSLLALYSYDSYIGENTPMMQDLHALEMKFVYVLFIISGFLLTFLKPKQDQEKITADTIDHLEHVVEDNNVELSKLNKIKHEFISNLQHEARTPIVGITSLGQVLWENYDKLDEEQRRKATEEIAKSSDRLTSLVNNMVDLSKLESLTYTLNLTKVNLSEILYEEIKLCKRIYLKGKDLEFSTIGIDDNVIVSCDEHYIKSTFNNLIVNAIQYSTEGKIVIVLQKEGSFVKFSISDEGIGIPKEELYDVFGEFIVSSKTKTPAGGRGLGLALCKKVIEAHGGKITVNSDGIKGAVFSFTLPVQLELVS